MFLTRPAESGAGVMSLFGRGTWPPQLKSGQPGFGVSGWCAGLFAVVVACLWSEGRRVEADAAPEKTGAEVVESKIATVKIHGAESLRRKTVVFDIDGGVVAEPDNWNPLLVNHLITWGMHQSMVEPLFILNFETSRIEPWLAEGLWPNENLDVWTLKLRPGIKWSDGEAFEAADVVFTVNLLLKHAPNLRDSALLAKTVRKVEPVDDLTVRFHLREPNARFHLFWAVTVLMAPTIVPEHIWRDQDPLAFKNHDRAKGWPVFTGPYRLERYSPTEFTYVRDNRWWGAQTGWRPLPRPERLVWAFYGSEAERAAAMATNGLDSLLDVSLACLLDLKQRNPRIITHHPDLPYAWVPDPCVRCLELNHTVAPWNDRQMRWALNHAIDRKEIVAFAYNGTTVAARHFFPAYPKLNRYVELIDEAGLYAKHPLMKYDPERTKAILASKGYRLNELSYFEKDGRELSLMIGAHLGHVETERVAHTIAEQLRRVGIRTLERRVSAAEYSRTLRTGDFEAMVAWHIGGSVIEPWASLNLFNASDTRPIGEWAAVNRWRWSGSAADQYTRWVSQISSLPLEDSRIDPLFVQAMDVWLDELPIIPLTQARRIIPFNSTYWTNWPTAKNNYVQPPTWWQSTHEIIHHLEAVEP